MSRTGNFGRMPRTAPSLTNTIIGIAREYQQQRSQNIMDAWQKGGTFEGAKVTDDKVLKFWRDKAGGVSKDDPLYDTYKNTVTQLDYTIHESKMTAQYALKKVSDAAMVNFYLGWAKKVPHDSEFYRVLQRDAGQYMRTNASNAKAEAARRKEEAYQKAQSHTQSTYEAGAEYMTNILRRIAQSGYTKGATTIGPLINPGDQMSSATDPGNGEDFTNFDAGGTDPNTGARIDSDPENMLRLLQIIDPQRQTFTPGGPNASQQDVPGNPDVLFHDDNKKPVTGKDIIAQLHKLDPTFTTDTPLDVQHIVSMLDRQGQGLQERIDRANKTGHPSDAANLTKAKAYNATLSRQVAAWPIEKSYASLRQTFDSVKDDPNASPAAVLKAHDDYVAGLHNLANDPTIAADDNLRSRIMAEANGQAGVPTLHESFTGLQNGSYDSTSATDSKNTQDHMDFLREQVTSVQNGEAVWTLGKTVNGVFAPDPTGREVGAVAKAQVDTTGAPGSGTFVTMQDPQGGPGATLTMYVTGTPIKTVASLADGTKVQPETDSPIGWAYTLPNGTSTDMQFGFKGKDGSIVISADPNFDKNLPFHPSSDGGNHFEVDISSTIPTAADPNDPTTMHVDSSKVNLKQNGPVAGMPGWNIQGAGDPTIDNPEGTPGTLTYNPYTASQNYPGSRVSVGGLDPTTDFHSLTLSHLISTPEGQNVLANLDNNKVFKDQLDADTHTYAGYQRDATGAWVPGQNADPNKLASAQAQVNLVQSARSFSNLVTEGFKGWQRMTTGNPLFGGDKAAVPGQGGLQTIVDGVQKLATDLVPKGDPFHALASAFIPGTNAIKPPADPMATGRDEWRIDKGMTVKTPTIQTIPTVVQTPGVTPGSTGTTKPPQSGSTGPSQTGSTGPSAGPNAATPPATTSSSWMYSHGQ